MTSGTQARRRAGIRIHARAAHAANLLGLLAMAGMSSCSNPLGSIDADYDRNLAAAPERLRRIERFDHEKYQQSRTAAELAPDVAQPRTSALAALERLTVSLEDARASTLENNLDLKVAKIDPSIAAERLKEEEAKFEAVFTPRAGYSETDAPTLDRTATNQQDSWQGGAGVSVPLRQGGRVSVDFTEGFNETNNPFFTLNSSHSNDLTFRLQQNLLRGAGRRVNTYSIRVAEYNRQLGEAATKLEVIRKLADVDRSYWILNAYARALQVRLDELRDAQQDMASIQRKVEAGVLRNIDNLRARNAAASKLPSIIAAENQLLEEQRRLKRLMNRPDAPVESATMLETATPPAPVPYSFDRDELVRVALEARMEMLRLELQLAQDFSAIEFAKNQALPSFVLDYRYSVQGLGRSLSEASTVLRDNEFESWSVSINGEIPIGNEAAKARVRQAILARIQRLSTRQAQQQAITEEVLSAIDRVNSQWEQVLAGRQALIVATETYDAERRLIEQGAKSEISSDLLTANTARANSELDLIQAEANYQIALVNLAFATGTLLGAAKVEWSPTSGAEDSSNDPTPAAFPLYADPQQAKVVPEQGRPLEPAPGH